MDGRADVGSDAAETVDGGFDSGNDAGSDASVDSGVDASFDGSTECLEPGDLEGVYLDRDWSKPINYIEDEFQAAISDQYLVWLVPLDGMDGKGVRFMDLKTKKAMQVPNCQKEWYFNELNVKGSFALWTNGYTPPNGQMRRAALLFDLTKKNQPRAVSRDAIGSVFSVHFHDNNLVYHFVKGPERNNYHTDMSTGASKVLGQSDAFLLYADIYEHTIITEAGPEFWTLNIDTLEFIKHAHNSGNRIFATGYYKYKVAFQSWIDSEKYGHPSTDIFIFDFSDDTVVRLTEDERSQWIPKIYDNLVMWQEVANEKAEEGFGYYVIHDLDTGVRRRIPGIENDGWSWGVTTTHAAIRAGTSSVSAALYLVDLEKAGVVKDGHVVPEAADGGTSGQ